MLLTLMLFKMELSVIAIIGVVMLVGIVKKNAIMMIDFAIDAQRNRGEPPERAIHQACLLRFRPIMMTTMAAIMGTLPIALGLGAGAELRQPLGIAVVGGLLTSQLLTLYITPVIYVSLEDLRRRVLGHAPTAAAPVASGRPSITFMFCTAWPEAPLVRLSSAEPMMTRPGMRSLVRPMNVMFEPRTGLGMAFDHQKPD